MALSPWNVSLSDIWSFSDTRQLRPPADLLCLAPPIICHATKWAWQSARHEVGVAGIILIAGTVHGICPVICLSYKFQTFLPVKNRVKTHPNL